MRRRMSLKPCLRTLRLVWGAQTRGKRPSRMDRCVVVMRCFVGARWCGFWCCSLQHRLRRMYGRRLCICGANGTRAAHAARVTVTPTPPHHAAPPPISPQTSGPPRRCADIGALGRSVCAPAGAAAAAASVATLCRPALQVGAQCVATVPRCGVGGPRAYGAGIRVGRQNARLQVQGAAISLLGGQATARCFPCLSRRPPLLLPSPGPGRRLCSQQRHLRHGDSRFEPCSRPARRDLARVARRRGELREEEREKTPTTTTPPPPPPPPHPPGRRPPA